MPAVSLSDFKRYSNFEGETEVVTLVSPSSMDSADTVDITNLLGGRTLVGLDAWDTTSADSVTATINASTDVVTVDASGGTTNHVYAITVRMIRN